MLTARERALAALRELRGEASEADPYGFGVRVSDALRTYIRDQHGLDAVTRTSVEFLEVLRDNAAFTDNEKAAISEFLESVDLLKYARQVCRRGRDSSSARDRRAGRARREPAANYCFQMTEGSPFGFSFAHPWVLLFLLLLPILAVLKGRFGGTAGVTFSSTSALSSLGRRRRSRAGALLALLTHLALASLIIALARPQLGRTLTRVEASGVDIMLALDVSRSMLAEDYTIGSQRANRIEAVKKVTEEFIRQRPNDRIGIVAFAGRPYLVSPLTLDHDWLIQNLDRLQIGLVEDGTAIGSALAAAANRLKDKEAEEQANRSSYRRRQQRRSRHSFDRHGGGQGAGHSDLYYRSRHQWRGSVSFTDPFGRTIYRNVLMQYNDELLRQIASITKGKYFRAADTHTLKDVFNEIDQMEKTKVNVEKTADYRDLFPMFLLAGFVLLGSEVLLSQTVWKRLP